MKIIIKILLKIKWTYLRYWARYRIIRVAKSMLRMYYIQELHKKYYQPTNDYAPRDKKMISMSYKQLRKWFIEEFPNTDPSDPYEKL